MADFLWTLAVATVGLLAGWLLCALLTANERRSNAAIAFEVHGTGRIDQPCQGDNCACPWTVARVTFTAHKPGHAPNTWNRHLCPACLAALRNDKEN